MFSYFRIVLTSPLTNVEHFVELDTGQVWFHGRDLESSRGTSISEIFTGHTRWEFGKKMRTRRGTIESSRKSTTLKIMSGSGIRRIDDKSRPFREIRSASCSRLKTVAIKSVTLESIVTEPLNVTQNIGTSTSPDSDCKVLPTGDSPRTVSGLFTKKNILQLLAGRARVHNYLGFSAVAYSS